MNDPQELQNLIDAHQEWLLIEQSGRSFALAKDEIEIEFAHRKTLFSFLDEKGSQTWRVIEFELENEEARLSLSRNFDRERRKIRLVPREPAKNLRTAVELARLAQAQKIAAAIKENFPSNKIIRAELNKENGRFAQIVSENRRREQSVFIADVSASLTPEILLSTAILRLSALEKRRRQPVSRINILAEVKSAKNLQKLHALLGSGWQSKIIISELAAETAENSENKTVIRQLPTLELPDLWRGKKKSVQIIERDEPTETARKIIAFSPEKIDAVFSKNGETLRFQGLPFARVRQIGDRETIHFGIEKERRLLSEDNFAEFVELIENLETFRRFDAPNKRHIIYQNAPEAWLEAILRRNIKLLDANLVLSPVYHQFRADRDQIDLLALRKDGRLIIIELKTAPDREMIFQAADYWRKIERERRLGNLNPARLFGNLEIADRPVVVYLVAPTLSFHPAFDLLAQTISPEIEIHRFNLAENWRENLKVLERKQLTAENLKFPPSAAEALKMSRGGD